MCKFGSDPAICLREEAIFVKSQTVPITWPLTLTLTLNTPWMRATLGTIMCKFSGDPAICLREDAIFVKSQKVSVSRDLRPWPWPWVDHGCGLYWGPSCASLVAIQPFNTVFEILSFKDIWVTTLRFWGDLTSSVTWPLDSKYRVSYRWSITTYRLSRTIFQVLSFKSIGVTTLAFRVTWRHRSCDHWIPKVWFLIGSQYEPAMYLTPLLRY